MKRIHYIIFLMAFGLSMLLADEAAAQTSRDSEVKEKSSSSRKVFKSRKVGSKKYTINYEQGLKEYEALMKQNKKKYAKMSKDMEKPQYSDPLYFGHKKKPKKRPLSKRKFCDECGIVH
ncbi:hypothetical protein [Reichenbachiella versicolor]|uniref:hypothetical protein n=1 Tax=Reichenbachiella versicolor TaxID=1821036 RepID=UPI0013A58336|nr:hypothetical protein [Reichenbachiella versicolor]